MAQLAARAREQTDGDIPCVYCGALATTTDHVPPRRARRQLIALGLEMTVEFVEFPACRECNQLLSDRDLWTLSERKSQVRRSLFARYRNELRIPDWHDGELAELSPQMRAYVLNGIAVRDFVRQRLRWALFTKSAPRFRRPETMRLSMAAPTEQQDVPGVSGTPAQAAGDNLVAVADGPFGRSRRPGV